MLGLDEVESALADTLEKLDDLLMIELAVGPLIGLGERLGSTAYDLGVLTGQIDSDAVRASTRAAQLSRTRYNAGSVNYLDVIDAERNMLSAERIGVQLAGSRMNSTVGLIKALGGGWPVGTGAQARLDTPAVSNKE